MPVRSLMSYKTITVYVETPLDDDKLIELTESTFGGCSDINLHDIDVAEEEVSGG